MIAGLPGQTRTPFRGVRHSTRQATCSPMSQGVGQRLGFRQWAGRVWKIFAISFSVCSLTDSQRFDMSIACPTAMLYVRAL